MKAVEILREEHRQIGLLLQCLDVVAERARTSGLVDSAPAMQILYLFETFVDERHQRKEELYLFPELLRDAGDEDAAQLRSLLDDHEKEFTRLRAMRSDLHGVARGEPASVRDFARDASAYVELQRDHFKREDRVLIPMAERLLIPHNDAELAAAFDALEGGPNDPHGVHEQVRALCKRLGVQPALNA